MRRTIEHIEVCDRSREQQWRAQQLKGAEGACHCVGQTFHSIWVNPGGRGVINNPADMWSGWWSRVSERACLNQCSALWYFWYQSSGGSGGMQPLFLNASGNVCSCSSDLGLICDLTLVIITLHWQAALCHSIRLSTFASSQLTLKRSVTFCTKLGLCFCRFLYKYKNVNFSLCSAAFRDQPEPLFTAAFSANISVILPTFTNN